MFPRQQAFDVRVLQNRLRCYPAPCPEQGRQISQEQQLAANGSRKIAMGNGKVDLTVGKLAEVA